MAATEPQSAQAPVVGEVVEPAGNELALRAAPIPAFLQEVGVRMAEMVVDAAAGTRARMVVIPDQVRAIANVIDPVSSLIQADPNWTPRISVVRLNPDPRNGPDFYQQAGGKLAPTKQALEKLRKAAGIVKTWTERIPRDQLADGERLGYKAYVQIRRSDGTIEEYDADKTFVEDAELEEIKDGVRRAVVWQGGQATDKPKWVEGTDEFDVEVRKRWLKELKDCSAKTQSKAILRAIRSALQIQHTFSPADAAKPFLVVGFNYTPSDDLAREQAAQAMRVFYGDTRLAITPGVVPQADEPGREPGHGPQTEDGGGTDEQSAREQQGTGASAPVPGVTEEPEPAAAADSSPPAAAAAEADPEAEEEPPPPPPDAARERAAAAGLTIAPKSAGQGWAGMPISEIHAAGDEGIDWLRYAIDPKRKWNQPTSENAVFGLALTEYVSFHLPELLEDERKAA